MCSSDLTGKTSSLKSFLQVAFEQAELEWEKFVETEESLLRPTDIRSNAGNPAKARKCLGWQPKTYMRDVVAKMFEAEMRNYA